MRSETLQRHAGLLVALHAASFWPVWRWYVDRLNDGSDEPWAIVALLAAALLSWPRQGFRFDGRDPLIGAAALLTLLYAALAPFTPPLVRAVVAMSALACSWVSIAGARERMPAIAGLLVLSVPVIASLQFYAGYPLRVVTATGATGVLNLFGFDVVRVGTRMSAGVRTVLVDAPCSGVRMLWTACVLSCVLAALRPAVGWRSMSAALALILPVVLLVNSVRAALLFLLETRPTPAPAALHSLVGIATFMLAAALILASETAQQRWSGSSRGRAVRMAVGTPS
ncbi:MAG: archaeosortase/exosortase family protein [Pseudomonadota bacterium]